MKDTIVLRRLHTTNVVYLNGVEVNLKHSTEIFNHAGQFDWGYSGSGPGQLALALLLCFLSPNPAVALHQRFKRQVVGLWNREWIEKVVEFDINEWIEQQCECEYFEPDGPIKKISDTCRVHKWSLPEWRDDYK